MTSIDGSEDFHSNTFLGRTLFRHSEARIARLKPIAIAKGTSWEPIADTTRQFPTEGSVFCRDEVAIGRPEGVYFTFRLVANEGQDRYRAVDVEEPLEVLRDFGRRSPEDQRRVAVFEGLDRGNQRRPQAILPLKGNRYVMPPLFQDRDTGLWVVAHGQDLARIPVYAAEGLFDGGRPVDAGRYFALPGQQLAKRVGLLNWEVDGDFLETVIGYVRKVAAKTPDPDLEGLSKKVIGRLRSALVAGEPLADQLEESESIRDRLPSFLAMLEGKREAGKRIAEALLNHPYVKSQVAELSQAERDAVRQSFETAMRTEIAERIEAEFKDKRLQIEAQNQTLTELQEEIDSASSRLDAIRIACDQDLTILRAGLADFRADVAKTDAALARISGLDRVGGRTLPVGEIAADGFNWHVSGNSGAPLCQGDEFAARLLSAAKSVALSSHLMIGFDVALRAGEVPCLTGPGSETLLAAYARVMSAGALHRQPIDATLLGPDDMLRRPGSGAYTPLADAWNAARGDLNRPFIVCIGRFDGFPLPVWFESFIDLYRSTRPPNLLVLAMASGDAALATTGVIIETRSSAKGATALLHGVLEDLPSTSVDIASIARPLVGPAKTDTIDRLFSSVPDDFDAGRALMRIEAAWPWEPVLPGVLDDVAKWPASFGSQAAVRIQDGHFTAAERSEIGDRT